MLKRPGVMRLWSYQALARGADGVLFFQWRKSFAGAEKFHGAMVEHVQPSSSRIFKEVCELGKELKSLTPILGSKIHAQCGILFDWENFWALELPSKPMQFNYTEHVQRWHSQIYDHNIPVDFVHPDGNLNQYKLIIAPVLYAIKAETAQNLKNYVKAGGTLLLTYFSGVVNEMEQVQLGGYPAMLRDVVGLWAEEWDPYPDGMTNSIIMEDGASFECGELNEIVHVESAETLGVFGSDFYKGSAAFTCNQYGKGKAYYLATAPEARFIESLTEQWIASKLISPAMTTVKDVEVTCREREGDRYYFLLNHSDEAHTVDLGEDTYLNLVNKESLTGEISLLAKDCRVLKLNKKV
jgi:beta-galactosidase